MKVDEIVKLAEEFEEKAKELPMGWGLGHGRKRFAPKPGETTTAPKPGKRYRKEPEPSHSPVIFHNLRAPTPRPIERKKFPEPEPIESPMPKAPKDPSKLPPWLQPLTENEQRLRNMKREQRKKVLELLEEGRRKAKEQAEREQASQEPSQEPEAK